MTKSKITKSALISSVVAMIICFAMLLGTTFAWFTDSATSGSNVIQAGNLDIVLEYWDGDSWENAEGKVLEFKKGGNYNGVVGDVLWEPGCTYELPAIRVRNEGNLTAKVLLKINGITGDEKLLEAIKFETKVTNVPASLKTGSAGATFTAMEGESYEFIYGTPDGTVMMDWSLAPKGETTPNTGHTDTTAEFTISGHMAEEAGNEYQGLKIEGVSITALATQGVYEYDSFGREYDENAGYDEPWDGVSKTEPEPDKNGVYHITNAAELVGLMDVTGNSIYIGKTILLENNIDLAGKTVKGIGSDVTNFAGTFDGQGFTISNFKIDATDRNYYAGLFNQVANVGTVKNLTVKNATVVGNSMVGAVASSVDGKSVIDNCKAIDCTVIGVKKVGAVVGYSAGSTVTNNYAENCTVLYSTDNEAGKVLGFENTGCTVSNNTDKNVTVTKGAMASTAAELQAALTNGGYVVLANDLSFGYFVIGEDKDVDVVIDLNGNTFEATNNITLSDNAKLTMKGGNFVVNQSSAHINAGKGNVLTFEDVNCSYNVLSRTNGSGGTNRMGSVFSINSTKDDANTVVEFKNCTLDNMQVSFSGSANCTGTIEATFENCTFNALTNSAPIYVNYNVKGTIEVTDCTFNIQATASDANAIWVNSTSSTAVTVVATNNTFNATKATPTDSSVTGVNVIKLSSTSFSNVSFIGNKGTTSSVTETGTIKTGIAQ